MIYSFKYIKPILALIIGAFIILLILQVQWLGQAIETNKNLFIQKMDAATLRVGELYRVRDSIPTKVHQALIYMPRNEELINHELAGVIDHAFGEFNIPLTYTFGIYKHGTNNKNEKVYGTTQQELLSVDGCDPEKWRTYGWTSLTCGKGYGNENAYHLAVFPSFSAFVIKDIKYPVILSTAALLLLGFGFYYLVKTLHTQKQISAIKNDFINNLTHEFKTPIFSISLASKSLRKSLENRASTVEYSLLNAIDQEGKRLQNQVDRILQLSLLENQKIQWSSKEVNIHTQIKEVVDGFQLILQEKYGQINLFLNAEQSFILADDLHLKNVWVNLVDNAIKYSRDKVDISISTYNSENGSLIVSIADKGIGISKDKKTLIFDQFYRVPTGNIHSVKGFGVGLAYVHGIVSLLKGSIEVNSKEKIGTTFKLILPNDV